LGSRSGEFLPRQLTLSFASLCPSRVEPLYSDSKILSFRIGSHLTFESFRV